MNLNLESTQSYIEQRIGDTTNTNGTNNQKLVIVLTVTLSIIALLAFIAIIITAIIIYRRRSSTIRLKELHDSNRLRQIVVSLSPTSIRLQYDIDYTVIYYFNLFTDIHKKDYITLIQSINNHVPKRLFIIIR
jgi:hypothetical protein